MNNDKLQHSHIFTCTTDTDFWDLLGQVSTLMETALISRRHGGIRWQQIGSWDLSEKVSSPIFPWKKNLSGQYFYVFLVVFIRSTSCCWSFHGHCIFIPGEEFSRPRWTWKDLFHPFSHCKEVDHTMKIHEDRWSHRWSLRWSHRGCRGLSHDHTMIQWESSFEVEAVWRSHHVADSSTQVMGHHWGREVRSGIDTNILVEHWRNIHLPAKLRFFTRVSRFWHVFSHTKRRMKRYEPLWKGERFCQVKATSKDMVTSHGSHGGKPMGQCLWIPRVARW